MRSNRRKLHELLGVVGTCATLRYPKSPPWVRVERDTPGHLILTNNETLVPQLLPESEVESRRYLHRLVAAEAARREADHIHCRAPKTADWKRLADAYLVQFRGVKESSALAREVLFEEMTRDVCLRFYIMGRRLRKARQRLFDTGKLTNNDLQELWMTYEQFDIEAHAGIDDEDLPERLRLHPSEPTRA